MFVIKMISLEGKLMSDSPEFVSGCYLKEYDPEAHNGRGSAIFTANIKDAATFTSFGQAFKAYRGVPRCRPLREDGEPNRPLTAFTVMIEPVKGEG